MDSVPGKWKLKCPSQSMNRTPGASSASPETTALRSEHNSSQVRIKTFSDPTLNVNEKVWFFVIFCCFSFSKSTSLIGKFFHRGCLKLWVCHYYTLRSYFISEFSRIVDAKIISLPLHKVQMFEELRPLLVTALGVVLYIRLLFLCFSTAALCSTSPSVQTVTPFSCFWSSVP